MAGAVSDLSEINPHAALWASENYESDGERAWLRWCRKVEKLIGHSLDGNQDCDGYSIDFAYACWEAGETAEFYANNARINELASEFAFGPRVT